MHKQSTLLHAPFDCVCLSDVGRATCAQSFLIMIGMFIVANGFALGLLYPTHLHLASDAASASGSAAEDSDGGNLWNMNHPTAVSDTVGTVPRSMYASFNMMMGSFDAALLDDAYSPALAYTTFFYYTGKSRSNLQATLAYRQIR